MGLTLSPDGRYVILSNDGGASSSPSAGSGATLVSGSSLAVVDTRSMKLVSTYHAPSTTFFMGIAAARDPSDPSRTIVLASDGAGAAVRVYDLDVNGQLTAEAASIALPSSQNRRAFPAGIAISSDGRTAYVADNIGDAVVPIDLATRRTSSAVSVGNFPFYVSAGPRSIIATATGLSQYAPVNPPARLPQFASPAIDETKSSSLSVFGLGGTAIGDPSTVRMDPAPDGTQIVGGAEPGATAVSRDGAFAYVALANVDRVAVVSLAAEPRVVRGLDLRLYPGAPYGAEPSALALSPDGNRLYVALAGLNAVAVLDARRPTRYRYGLIPTGWYPTALQLSSNGRYLYIAATKGVDGWGILQRVDLKHTSLVKATLSALRYNRTPKVAEFNPVIPPLRSNKRSEVIDRVVYVGVSAQTYDAMLGDLKDDSGAPHGNGDAALNRYGESLTPNLHALARTYALADNFYASDPNSDLVKEVAAGGEATLYQQLVAAAGAARAPLDDHGDDPEDYGRTGFLFNALARAGLDFRDYGGLLRLSGYDGVDYHLNVPALAALNGHIDLAYAGWNPKITDAARAAEFIRDMQRYVESDRMPSFTYVLLPSQSDQASVTDADKALGKIVEYLSHTPHWSSTAIFIEPQGADSSSSDHVNALRSYALVVSPLARRGYVGHEHLSAAGVVKTEEEILGLPPLTLSDLLASDMSDFFMSAPVPNAYQAH
jgi:DNA-binding beta-propeller fold protein YncE